jgi:hypothetical protein
MWKWDRLVAAPSPRRSTGPEVLLLLSPWVWLFPNSHEIIHCPPPPPEVPEDYLGGDDP